MEDVGLCHCFAIGNDGDAGVGLFRLSNMKPDEHINCKKDACWSRVSEKRSHIQTFRKWSTVYKVA